MILQMQAMVLIENKPLDTQKIADLISDKNDLPLVWPIARWPFDHQQWREVLDPEKGNVSFLVYDKGLLIGHAALLKTAVPQTYSVAFLYLLPNIRLQGKGRTLVGLLESYAVASLGAKRLHLVVRDYNPAAYKCYLHCGFTESGRKGTLIKMQKEI